MATDREEKPPIGALQLGRYSVLHPLGAGAMGIVYAAYDPELDRRVALKLLHAGTGDAAAQRTRLLREAQAMARLSHPNVIAVHDVGTVQGQVFVAMEFVEGKTLAGWLAEKPRPWREILRLFILAGRGLAAAHAAGVVHRDFKPENVLVGNDGRVRVTDFGLARSQSRAEPANPNSGALEGGPVRVASQTDTDAAGSPAYMAPEQLRREKVDARADQFSYCVALYAGLYGERPFAAGDLRALIEEIEQGRVRKEPEGTRVPKWVRRVLSRGLMPRAADRFPTLDALLEALESDPAARWRKLGLGLSVIALVGIAAAGARWQSDKTARACRGAEEKLRGIWDAPLREKGKAAFAATGLAYADATWALAEKDLDRYANSWTAMRTDACEATAVRKDQTPELLDLRMACLDDRLRALGAVSALFANADRDLISRAANVVGDLPSIAGCADAAALRAPGAPTAAEKPAVDALRDRLARTTVLANAGKPQIEAAQEISEAANKIGYAPLQAEATFLLGRVEHLAGDEKDAVLTLADATAAALGAKNDTTLAETWIDLLGEYLELSQLDAADRAAQQATAAVNRLSESSPLRPTLFTVLAGLARAESRLEDAQRFGEEAVALVDRIQAPPASAINAVGDLGVTLAARALWDQSLRVQTRAFEMAVANYGPDHPVAGEMEEQLGETLIVRERLGEARTHLTHGLSVMENALGKDHPAIGDALNDLGSAWINADAERAIGYLQRALHVEGADKGEENSGIVFTTYLLGSALQMQKQLKPARAMYERAMAMEFRISHNPDDLESAMAGTSLAGLLIDEGDLKAARPVLEAAFAAQKKGYGPEHPQTADSIELFGRMAFLEHRYPQARRLAEEALAIARKDLPGDSTASIERELLIAQIDVAEGHGESSLAVLEHIVALPSPTAETHLFDLAQARFLLARVLWANKAERPRALQLAKLASEGTGGAPTAKELAETKRWIAAHAN